MRTLLVTGCSGFIGRKLLARLILKKDISLRALVHETPFYMAGCETVKGDLNDVSSLYKAVMDVDTVIHLAAVTHSVKAQDYFQVNFDGTRNLVHACLKNHVRRFVYISSLAANPSGGDYAVSKLKAEEFLKPQKISWVIVQPSEVYGPGSNDAINKLIDWVDSYPVIPIIGSGDYRLAPVYIDDMMEALVQVSTHSNFNQMTFILAGPESISYNDLIDRLGRIFGHKRIQFSIPVGLANFIAKILAGLGLKFLMPDQIPRLLTPKNHDISLAKRHLKFNPRSLEEGLRLCLGMKG